MTERDAAAPTWGSNLSPSPKRLSEQPVEARRTGGTAMQTSSDFPFHAMTFRDHAALEVLKAMLGSPRRSRSRRDQGGPGGPGGPGLRHSRRAAPSPGLRPEREPGPGHKNRKEAVMFLVKAIAGYFRTSGNR